jgi:hypothetical protein
MLLYHGSNNPLKPENISIVRKGSKQDKKGRLYGGFYCADNIEHAMGYGMPLRVTLYSGIKTFHKSGDITRLSAEYINSLLNQGYQMVIGKDLFGRIEYVIIDKSAIKSID